ncbi:sugar ABC transporter substrate-binding protein [Shinella sp. BYT-45]|uniref:sugar ABC transporter substrate-binding protein n=1 Tax=Shinella sp. BYT-45 TaxID=3377377 RepID=UPI00397FA623
MALPVAAWSQDLPAAAEIVEAFAFADVKWAGPETPVKAEPGKTLVIVALTMNSVSNQRVAAGIQEAAAKLGWQTTLVNSEGNIDKFAAGIDTAVTTGADGIALMGTLYVPQALERAREAAIPIVGSIDTTENPFFAQGYYAHMVAERGVEIGAAAAAQLVVDLGAETPVALFAAAPGDPLGDLLVQGAKQVLEGAGNPILAELSLEFPELGTGTIGQKAVAAVQANPQIGAFWVSWDAPASEIVTAFRNAGIDLPVYSTYGDPQNIDFIRNGQLQKADVLIPLEWAGYAVVDNFVRIFAGQPLAADAPDGVPIKLLNTQNLDAVLPEGSTEWDGGFDFRTRYETLWGLGS